eukprot:3636216-Karenia_brevis.AAC.1
MLVDEEGKKTKEEENKNERGDAESYPDSYKEDEGKDRKKRRKQKMREPTPAKEIQAAENVIKM